MCVYTDSNIFYRKKMRSKLVFLFLGIVVIGLVGTVYVLNRNKNSSQLAINPYAVVDVTRNSEGSESQGLVEIEVWDVINNQSQQVISIDSCELNGFYDVYRLNSMVDAWGVNCADKVVVFDIDQVLAELNYDDIGFDKALYWKDFVMSPNKKLLAYPDKQPNVLSVYNIESKEITKHEFKFKSITDRPEYVSIGVGQFVNDNMIVVFDSVRSGNLGNEALLYNFDTQESKVIARYKESSLEGSVAVSPTATDREVGDFLFAPIDSDNNYYRTIDRNNFGVYNPITDMQSIKTIIGNMNESICVSDYCNDVNDVSDDGKYVLVSNGGGAMVGEDNLHFAIVKSEDGKIVHNLDVPNNLSYVIPKILKNKIAWISGITEDYKSPTTYTKLTVRDLVSGETMEFDVSAMKGDVVDFTLR
jgi:hypothetical protein